MRWGSRSSLGDRQGPPSPTGSCRAGQAACAGRPTRRSAAVSSDDVATWCGIPLTNVPRPLVDLASSLPEPALARACHEAGMLHRTTPRHVGAVLGRLPNARGRTKLDRVLHGKAPVTLSRLERRFLSRLKEAGLPHPIMNRVASGRRVDCRWPQHQLTVELDSYRYHHSRHAWEQDRRREREAPREEMSFVAIRGGTSSRTPRSCSPS